jgi:hypothetical protein
MAIGCGMTQWSLTIDIISMTHVGTIVKQDLTDMMMTHIRGQ